MSCSDYGPLFWYIGDFRLATNPLAQRTADMIAVELRMIKEYNSTEMLDKKAKFLIRGEHTTGSENELRSISREGKRATESEIREYYVVALPELGWKYMGKTAEYCRGKAITRVHLFEKGDLYLKIRFEVSKLVLVIRNFSNEVRIYTAFSAFALKAVFFYSTKV